MIRIGALLGLLAFTGWTVTRSEALDEAETAYRRGNFIQALRHAEDHLDRRPWSGAASLVAARCLSQLDFADAAEPFYGRRGSLRRDDLHVRAYGLVRANQRRRAVEAYTELLARWPRDALALRRLSAVLMTDSRWNDALIYANRLARIPGSEVEGYSLLGAIGYLSNNPVAGIAASERALKIDPNLVQLRNGAESRPAYEGRVFLMQLAENLLKVGRVAEACRYLEKALATQDDTVVRELLGEAYYLDGNFAAAREAWQRVVEINPQSAATWLNLGRLAQAENRHADAIAPLLRAHEIKPNAFEPPYRLALVYRFLGQSDNAKRFQRIADEIRRHSGPPTHGMGLMPATSR